MAAIILNSSAENANDFVAKNKFRVVSRDVGDGAENIEFLSGAIDYVSGQVDNTNDLVDELAVDQAELLSSVELIGKYYTGFEVYPHSGHMTHSMFIRTWNRKLDNNVLIDWGDGDWTRLSDVSDADYYRSKKNMGDADLSSAFDDATSTTNKVNEYNVQISHTYTDATRHIVNIYGNDYWGMFGQASYGYDNLVSRIFDRDLPLNPCVQNLASFCESATYLTAFNAPNYYDFSHVTNWSNCFRNCTELLSANAGDKNRMFINVPYAATAMFQGCSKLKTTNINLPWTLMNGNYSNFFSGCEKLAVNISKLIPSNGIFAAAPNFTSTFQNCKVLTGTIDSIKHLLWESPLYTTTKWTSTNCFKGSSLSGQAIVKFGGTKADPTNLGKGGQVLAGETFHVEDVDDMSMDEIMSILKTFVSRAGGSVAGS